MRHIRSIAKVQLLHPLVRQEVKEIIEQIEKGWPVTMAIALPQTLRTFEEQDALYKLGRTVKNPDGSSKIKPMGNIVTNAKGGQSWHNYGTAFDFVIAYDKDNNGSYESMPWSLSLDFNKNHEKDWDEVVKVFKSKGWEWGGEWKHADSPHLQKRYGHPQNPTDLLELYKQHKFIPGTHYVLMSVK